VTNRSDSKTPVKGQQNFIVISFIRFMILFDYTEHYRTEQKCYNNVRTPHTTDMLNIQSNILNND